MSILVVAFAVFAWQGGNGSSGGPLNAIAAAAERTQDEPGARVLMRSIVTMSGQPRPFTMTGHMVYNAEGRTRAVIRTLRTAPKGPMKLDAISDGTTMYLHSAKFGSLPEGAKWMMLDFSHGDETEMPVPTNVDARGELALLESAGADVRKLGKEDVRGVPTTHYRGSIPTADGKGPPFHVEVWVDAKGLVRRMRLARSEPSGKGGGTTTIDMRLDFFDFGIEPEIEVPDSSEVFDATAMAEASSAGKS